jgi:dolichyl-phosphate beta-glucosyltransferase
LRSPVEQRDGGEPSLTLVIPAYREAERIAGTARAAAAWLAARSYAADLIVVDDGSDDGTARLARAALAGAAIPWRVLEIPHGGKAAALRAGMSAATGAQVAFSDADLATPLDHLDDLRAAVARGCDVAIGSREGSGAQRHGEPEYRHLMGRGFNLLVRLLLLPGLHDTQCGFKLFRREAVRDVLARARLYREGGEIAGARVTAFDVELLAVARARGWRICAVPVDWTYGEASKVHPLRDSWHNARDVFAVWMNQKRGRYR